MMNKQNASTKRPPSKVANGKPATQQQPEEQPQNAPVARISMWPVSVSIWQRYSAEGQPYYSATFQRTYKDSNDKWQYSDLFFPNDLLLLAEAARAAFHRISALRTVERADKPQHVPQQRYQAEDSDVPF